MLPEESTLRVARHDGQNGQGMMMIMRSPQDENIFVPLSRDSFWLHLKTRSFCIVAMNNGGNFTGAISID
jgi:hypothetical protein